jgi:phage tail-like protein
MAKSTDAPTQRSELYPPSAFHFELVFAGTSGEDASFQEVSGIGSEIDVQEVVEGGENRFVHRLPKGVKHPLLSLKRGIADIKSPLVKWCKTILEGDFAEPIETREVKVYLLDENQDPLRGWSFTNAYPVKWEIDSFNSTKNEVAIETIDLSYNSSNRIV